MVPPRSLLTVCVVEASSIHNIDNVVLLRFYANIPTFCMFLQHFDVDSAQVNGLRLVRVCCVHFGQKVEQLVLGTGCSRIIMLLVNVECSCELLSIWQRN